MIRSHFGLLRNPFDSESITLLAHQQEIFDILRVHAQQGGLCLVLGEPGTGKSVLKQALLNHDPKRMITPVVNRTLHTYHNTLRILCEAFQIEFEGRDHRCERLLVQEAFRVHRASKLLVPIIDDAHLMPTDCLRKLRLLCEDFPHSHNLVLIGHQRGNPLPRHLFGGLASPQSRNHRTVHPEPNGSRRFRPQYLHGRSPFVDRPLRRRAFAPHPQPLLELPH